MIMLWPINGIAEDKSVHLATLNWAPYIGEDLESFGFGAEILRVAFQRAGYETTFSFMPWVRALKDVEIGKYDAVCFAYHSSERSAKYIFTVPYAQSVLGFFTLRESDIKFQTFRDLAPFRIGVVRGFVNTPEFDALDFLKKEEAKNELLNLKKLIHRRVDLVISDKFIMRHLIKRHLPDKREAIIFLEPPLIKQPLYLMFSRELEGSASKVLDFNRAIENMQKDGSIKSIIKRFGYAHED